MNSKAAISSLAVARRRTLFIIMSTVDSKIIYEFPQRSIQNRKRCRFRAFSYDKRWDTAAREPEIQAWFGTINSNSNRGESWGDVATSTRTSPSSISGGCVAGRAILSPAKAPPAPPAGNKRRSNANGPAPASVRASVAPPTRRRSSTPCQTGSGQPGARVHWSLLPRW